MYMLLRIHYIYVAMYDSHKNLNHQNQKPNVLNPSANINRISLPVSGVFALEQQYDNHIYLPVSLVEKLVERPGQRTALELYLNDEDEIENVKSLLKSLHCGKYALAPSYRLLIVLLLG